MQRKGPGGYVSKDGSEERESYNIKLIMRYILGGEITT